MSGTEFQSIIDLAEDDINPSDDAGVKSWDTPTTYTDPTPYSSFGNFYEQFEVTNTDTVVYNVPKGTMANYGEQASGDSFGTVVSDINNLNTEDAKITVKVLERKYHMGEYSDKYNFKARFDGGIREKDYIKIQINCEINWNGVPTTTSAIYMTIEQSKPPSSKAITSLSDIASGTSIAAYGGASSLFKGTLNWTNNSGTSEDIFLQGNYNSGSTDPMVILNEKNIFFVRGSMMINDNVFTDTHVDKGATYYLGTLLMKKGLGSAGHEVNVVTKKLFVNDYSDNPIQGRVYCEDFCIKSPNGNGKNVVKGDVYCNYLVLPKDYVDTYFDEANGKVTFYVNVKDDGNNAAASTQIITDGTKLDNFVVDGVNPGKIYVAKGIKIVDGYTDVMAPGANSWDPPVDKQGNYVFESDHDGELNIGGSMKKNPGDAASYTVDIDFTNMTKYASLSSELKLDYEAQDIDGNGKYEASEQDFSYDASSGKKVLGLPVPLIGSGQSSLTLDTPKSLYSSYFVQSAIGTVYPGKPFDIYGDFNAQKTDADETNYDPSKLQTEFGDFSNSNANFRTFVDEHIDQPSSRNTNVNRTALNYSEPKDISTAGSEVQAALSHISGSIAGYYDSDFLIPSSNDLSLIGKDGNWFNSYRDKVYIIDATGGSIDVQMSKGTGGDFGGTFVVVGNGEVNFLFPDSANDYSLGNEKKMQIYDYDLGNAPSDLYLGSNSPSPTPAPNIYYICSNGCKKVGFGQNNSGQAFQGYVYAPYTTFALLGGNNGFSTKIHVDSKDTGSHNISVIGSVFCKNWDSAQTVGVAFIDPGNTSTNPGERLFGWTDVLYTRGA